MLAKLSSQRQAWPKWVQNNAAPILGGSGVGHLARRYDCATSLRNWSLSTRYCRSSSVNRTACEGSANHLHRQHITCSVHMVVSAQYKVLIDRGTCPLTYFGVHIWYENSEFPEVWTEFPDNHSLQFLPFLVGDISCFFMESQCAQTRAMRTPHLWLTLSLKHNSTLPQHCSSVQSRFPCRMEINTNCSLAVCLKIYFNIVDTVV